jgi:predicted metal-dependent TIM-barrel fold hydrolase
MSGAAEKENGAGDSPAGAARARLACPCPCCGAGLALQGEDGAARLEADDREHTLPAAAGTMFIDPHAHMIARTTDDYDAMARAGIVAVIEPAFWLGQPRTNPGSYVDYLSTIVGFEKFRAGQFGIRHYCCVGLNPKEANNEALAEAVFDVLFNFAVKESVVAIGELGYDEQTELEDKYLRKQIELAKEFELPIMIHTPHRDKKRGTLRTMDVLGEHGFDPRRCVIDHNTEETVREVLDRGYFAAFSIYPQTKMGNERMTEIVRQYGPDRIIVDSACDWGVSDPLAVPKTAALMAERSIAPETIRKVTYENALAAYGLSGAMKESDWLQPSAIDQRTLFEGNSVLRGGQAPRISATRRMSDDLRIA